MQEECISTEKASKNFNISQETLRQWANIALNPLQVGSGHNISALTELEEDTIILVLEQSARRGWPCGPEKVKLIWQSFLNKAGKKTHLEGNLHGED